MRNIEKIIEETIVKTGYDMKVDEVVALQEERCMRKYMQCVCVWLCTRNESLNGRNETERNCTLKCIRSNIN